jgi:hypothetical protein
MVLGARHAQRFKISALIPEDGHLQPGGVPAFRKSSPRRSASCSETRRSESQYLMDVGLGVQAYSSPESGDRGPSAFPDPTLRRRLAEPLRQQWSDLRE